MKIEKKHVIVLIIVAFVLFVLWKRGVFNKDSTGNSTETPKSNLDLDYILSHVAFTGTERNRIRKIYKGILAKLSWRELISSKSIENGTSFDQQAVLDALWLLYDDGTIDDTRYHDLLEKVQTL